MNLVKKAVSAVAATSMLMSVSLPVLGSTTTIQITGNGSGTTNVADVNQTSTQTTTQNNVATVNNTVNADAVSGGNSANFNTGGMVTVASGPATTDVDVTNVLNTNAADVDCCGANSATVEISDNGAGSVNQAYLDLANKVNVTQDNVANVNNTVDADAVSGWNRAIGNTGDDALVTVAAGAATTDVDVTTVANTNSAVVHPAMPGGSMVSAMILDNGSGSNNLIKLGVVKSTRVDQDNLAYINNTVDALAKSGKNAADYNTGAEVLVGSGAATAGADILNSVNFNHADVDCGCHTNVLAKIAGNGAGYPYEYGEHSLSNLSLPYWYFPASQNMILANLVSNQTVGQDNLASLNNYADVLAKSGWNHATANTGDHGGDPAVVSGPATTHTTVVNDGNVNTAGDTPWTWPWAGMPMPQVEWSMNFNSVWALLWGSWMS